MSIRNKVIECLDNIGISINTEDEDTNINEYDVDSISFISFVVEIEKEFGIEIPDGYLYSDILSSLNGFIGLLEQLISQKEISSATN